MTFRKRKTKDTVTKGLRRSAVQNLMTKGQADTAGTSVSERVREAAGGNEPLSVRGETRLRIDAEGGASGDCRASEAEQIRSQLAHHVGALRFVNGTLAVCVQALQQQNAELDAEIACVLQRTAGDKLDATTDSIEALALGLELEASC